LALENAVCEDPFPKPGGHPEGEGTNDSANRRSQGGRRGSRLPRRFLPPGRAGRSARAHSRARRGDGADPRAPLRSRPGGRDPRPRDRGRRRRRSRLRPRRAARPGGPIRAGGLGDDGPPGGEVDRRGSPGSDPRRPRRGAGQSLGCRRPTRGADPRHRRLTSARPFREGERRRQLQGRLRLSPAALLPGRDGRAVGRRAAARERRRAYRRRSLRGLAVGARTASRG